jgi:hypothetical protein
MSMKQNKAIEEKVDEVMRSLDGLQQAEPQPWFYARTMARMRREESSGWSRLGMFLSRPVTAIACLCVILGCNIFFLVREPKVSKETKVATVEAGVESESIIASTSSYDYENLVQP